ncbi:MAG: IS4 family transposase [Ignavibacteriales bacterium]|nr:IS4 family transposase [Ignavibacteriales bacterium]
METLRKIETIAEESKSLGISNLARRVCQWLGWKNPTGEYCVSSCVAGMRSLERRGFLKLPWDRQSRAAIATPTSSLINEDQEKSRPICGRVDKIGPIELMLVNDSKSKEAMIYKEVISRYHYLGYQRLVGAQMRYLIRCDSRWIGAIGFAASALHVADRDKHIGWSERARRAHLQEVVGNARFTIFPWVRVKNLASKVLSLVAKRIRNDWFERYGYEPLLLETYVDREKFRGTCYRGAGWIRVGKTAGRGRQDVEVKCEKSAKDIYLYPLNSQWQRRLCREPLRRRSLALQQPNQSTSTDCEVEWVEQELVDVDLGDKRRGERLIQLVKDFYRKPQASILDACNGVVAKVKAAYKLINNKAVSMEKILTPHYSSTVERMREQKIVLAVQDTVTLNYASRPDAEGLGYIGTTVDGAQGYLAHDTLVLTPEGLPLGLIDVQAWARDNAEFGKKKAQYSTPIEGKESIKWLKSFEAASEAQRLLPDTTVVSVGDREGDVYELFLLAESRRDNAKLLIRAKTDRSVLLAKKKQHLWEALRSIPMAGTETIQVPRRSARSATKAQPTRTARLGIRYCDLELLPPQQCKCERKNIRITAILAEELDPPQDVKEPLEWMLLTTMPVASFEEALEKVQYYRTRFGIEVYHKVLKSGCKVEERQHHHIEGLQNALALDMIVGWRIMYLTMLGRVIPDMPCDVVFEADEWRALYGFVNKTTELPDQPPTLAQATLMVAKLGGFLGRKCDGAPGVKTMWKGMTRLEDITEAFRVFYSGASP